MEDAIWRINDDQLLGYTEDKAVWTKIRRSYPDIMIQARYYAPGEDKPYALQYLIPNARKRSARNLFGCKLTV
ncbi:hypothetical protein [Paenibacillus sp. J22TS3]|uniref:hypothetical protein n=1 Tax=Paenibacillus sp. J22TS3 TaxID=2807192 RepID=UPI001B1BDB56|nr:hypothetical protein [Paenibacillus sp. J22TS3]GIP21056.1 hypothetical protein J22TS3_13310 [Paenibacillus sp. J22TS3]